MDFCLIIVGIIAVAIAIIVLLAIFYCACKPAPTKLNKFIQEYVVFTDITITTAQFEDSGLRLRGYSKESYKKIVENLFRNGILQAEDQRENYQFAYLLLLNVNEPENGSFLYKPSKNGSPYVNSNEPFLPPKDKFHNYIIARPMQKGDRRKHAEEIILDEFNDLWDSYLQINSNQRPKSIVLYSWIMPCSECTEKIINTLSRLGVPVYIAYTISYKRKETKQQQKDSRKRITSSRMTIEKVEYPHRLQPK